jgi:hypothetical protein
VEAYDGPQIVGMDLHRRRSVLVRMTPDGRRLDTARITSSPAELRREMRKAGEHPKVGAGSHLRLMLGGRHAGGSRRGSAPGAPAGGESLHLPPGQKRSERRR